MPLLIFDAGDSPTPGPRHFIAHNFAALVVLTLAGMVAAAFFVCIFGVNAEGLGRHDFGMAIALAYFFPWTLVASMPIALVAIIGAIWARMLDLPTRLWLAAVAVALLPITCLLSGIEPLRP